MWRLSGGVLATLLPGLLLSLLLGLLPGCATEPSFRQSAALPPGAGIAEGKAVVVIAIDIREQTSLRDIAAIGGVYFRKLDSGYASRPKEQYDFAVVNGVAADWAAVFGQTDTNRLPYLFQVEPGTYVIDRLTIGAGGPSAPGYHPATGRVTYGMFRVEAGEVVNLGKFTAHLFARAGQFKTRIEPNEMEARQALAAQRPDLVARLQTRMIDAPVAFRY